MIRCIAVYPAENPESKTKQWEQYLTLAEKYGFQEVFSSIHIPELPLPAQIASVRSLSAMAHKHGMDLCVDIGGAYISEILKDRKALAAVKNCRIDTIRLDYGYKRDQIKQLYKKLDVKGFVLNASIYSYEEAEKEIQFLQSLSKDIVIRGCHNYYPLPETGLDASFAMQQDEVFKKWNIPVIYCIPSMTNPRLPMHAGLPTIEKHRYAGVSAVMLDLIHNFHCEAVMFADEFFNESEFAEAERILEKKTIAIPVLLNKASEEEREIILKKHVFRYDSNDSILRSQSSREMASFAKSVIPCSCTRRHIGDIIILNRNAKRYSGEMQVAEKEMPRSTMANVIGRIDHHSMELLSYCRYGYTYDFKEKES